MPEATRFQRRLSRVPGDTGMPLSASIDPKGYFASKMAACLDRVVSNATDRTRLIAVLESSLSGNPQKATSFFAAAIFDDPTFGDNKNRVCRALTCVEFLTTSMNSTEIESRYRALLAEYASDVRKQQLRLQLVQSLEKLGKPAAAPSISPPQQQAVGSQSLPTVEAMLSPKMETRFRAVLARRRNNSGHGINMHQAASEVADRAKLAGTTLEARFAKTLAANQSNLITLGQQLDLAFGHFSRAYRDIGKGNNSKIAVLSSVVSSGLGLIPVAGPVLSVVIGAAIKQFNSDEELPLAVSTAPPPKSGSTAAVLDQINDFLKVGVKAPTLPTNFSLQTELTKSWNEAVKLANAKLEEYIGELFQVQKVTGSIDAQAAMRQQVGGWHGAASRIASVRGSVPQTQSQIVAKAKAQVLQDETNLTVAMENEICLALHSQITSTGLATNRNMAQFVELHLWANYFRQLVGEKIFDAGFSKINEVDISLAGPEITRLEELKIIQKKDKMNYATALRTNKALPYDGHAVHNMALVLFFQWYYKNVNPFAVIGRTKLTGEALTSNIASQIQFIGAAIDANKTRSSFFNSRTTIKDTAKLEASYKKLAV